MSHPGSNGKKTEVSAEPIRFPSSLWTPWVFHTSVVVCDHESFMYLKRLPTAYDSWGSSWPLAQPTATTQNSCPTMLISPERFHPEHAVIFVRRKKVVAFCLETVRVSHVTRFEPKLRWKNDYFSNKLATETSAWPCEKEKHAGFQRESRKSCSTESGSCAGCLFLAPKRICLKACWWVQR